MDFNSITDLKAYAALGGFQSAWERQQVMASARYKADPEFRAVVDGRIAETDNALLPGVRIVSEESTFVTGTGEDGDRIALSVSQAEGLAAEAELQKLRPDQSGRGGMGLSLRLDGVDILARETEVAARRREYVQATMQKHAEIFGREATPEQVAQMETIARRDVQ